MGQKDELSATMAVTLGEAIEHGGKLVRMAGGFWTYPGCPYRPSGSLEWWVGASTINALEKRGRLQFSEWKEGRNRRFPIAAEVVLERQP